MEIVIDISEKIYNEYMNLATGRIPTYKACDIAWVLKNGTVLPKGCDIQRIIPKRVNVQKWIYTKCPNPNCDYVLSTHHGDGYYSIEHKPNFCPNCGQALLWESEE